MKRDLPEPDPETSEEECGFFDHSADGETVLEQVDNLLAKHGLEMVTFDTGADFYQFTIRQREGDSK